MLDALEPESPSLNPLLLKLPSVLVHSRAESTTSAYFGVFSAWKRWATANHVVHLPAKPLTVSLYLLSKIQEGDSYAVCKAAFYGLKYFHTIQLQPDPTEDALVRNMLEAAKRLDTHVAKKKEPLTIGILHEFHTYCTTTASLSNMRLLCMCLLGFSGFLRFDELAHLTRGDFSFFPTHMTVFIEKSKTDQYRDGKVLYISRTDSRLCPVACTIDYLKRSGLHHDHTFDGSSEPDIDSVAHLYLFRGISSSKSGEKLRTANKPISYTRIRELLLKALSFVGVDSKRFGTHSLRSGGATAAANAGVPDRLFKRHGRWRSENAKDGYIKDDVEKLLLVSRSIGL
jgi:integrase